MSRLPDAHDLLQTARESLLQRLLPALPAELHYEARMLASALAIALRERAAAEENQLTREVALAIRCGEHDDGALFPALLAHTRAKLRISNPRLLEVYAGIFD